MNDNALAVGSSGGTCFTHVLAWQGKYLFEDFNIGTMNKADEQRLNELEASFETAASEQRLGDCCSDLIQFLRDKLDEVADSKTLEEQLLIRINAICRSLFERFSKNRRTENRNLDPKLILIYTACGRLRYRETSSSSMMHASAWYLRALGVHNEDKDLQALLWMEFARSICWLVFFDSRCSLGGIAYGALRLARKFSEELHSPENDYGEYLENIGAMEEILNARRHDTIALGIEIGAGSLLEIETYIHEDSSETLP